MDTSILAAAEFLSRAGRIVTLTGAGVSAESGVPTFRDAQTGLWAQYDPDTLASPGGFAANPGLVWRWYMMRLAGVEQSRPNPGHLALARLQSIKERFLLYTQNVDDLHERAGSAGVRHLHGSLTRFRCHRCRTPYALAPGDREREEPPSCASCGGAVRPDVVWFGEMLPERLLEEAWQEARNCDLMLVVGTSGLIQPAAQIPFIAKGGPAVIIDVNPDPGAISRAADVFLQGPSGEVLPAVLSAMGISPLP